MSNRSHEEYEDLKQQREPLIQKHKQSHIYQMDTGDNDSPRGSEANPKHSDSFDLTNQLVTQCKARIEAANLEKEAATEQVPYSKLLMTYADGTDKLLMVGGFFFSFCTGAGMPSMVFLFGDIINTFQDGSTTMVEALKPTVITLAVIGGIIWVVTYLYFVMLVILAERIGKKTRVAYLKAILSQEVAWFDSINVTELSSRLSKECQAI